MPTTTACNDTEWANTVAVVVVIVVDVAGRRNNGSCSVQPVFNYLFLSLVRQPIAICLMSATIFDQYSMLLLLIIFRSHESSIANSSSSHCVIACVCNSSRSFLQFPISVLFASTNRLCMFIQFRCISVTKEYLYFFGYRLGLLVSWYVCFTNALDFLITSSSLSATILPQIQRLIMERYKLGEHRGGCHSRSRRCHRTEQQRQQNT